MSLQTPLSPEFFPLAIPFVAAPDLHGDLLTIAIAGELDMATIPLLQEAHTSVQGSYQAVLYELEGLDFMDSAGLRALLAPSISQVPISEISMTHPTRAVRRLLELRGLQAMIAECDQAG